MDSDADREIGKKGRTQVGVRFDVVTEADAWSEAYGCDWVRVTGSR